jgi:hypothetical protein
MCIKTTRGKSIISKNMYFVFSWLYLSDLLFGRNTRKNKRTGERRKLRSPDNCLWNLGAPNFAGDFVTPFNFADVVFAIRATGIVSHYISPLSFTSCAAWGLLYTNYDLFASLLSCHFCTVTRSGEAIKIEEYVPAVIPIRRAKEKLRVASPPTT